VKTLTVEEGFEAVKKFLDKWYGFTKSDDIAFMLSGMGMDPAFYQDWQQAVQEVLRGKMNAQLTTVEAFHAMVKFLEKYYEFTKSDDIGSLLGGMDQGFWDNESTFDPALWKDWVESVDAVLKEKS
jgi:hypothetical protein